MPLTPPPVARLAVAAAAALLLAGPPAAAQNAVGKPGLYVGVPSPLTGEAVQRIVNRIETARGRADQRPAVVVFDFNPTGKDAAADNFGVSYTLAKAIAGWTDLTTVAYVPRKVAGHAVLPALACKELAMGPDGVIGDVLGFGTDRLTGTEANGYAEWIGPVRPAQFAAVRKMYDPEVQLRKGKKNAADWYFDLREREKAEEQGVRVADTAELPSARDGRVGLFPAAAARDIGLCQAVVEDRRELAELYGLSTAALREDPLAGREAVGFRYVLRGPIDGGVREGVRRMAEKVIREKGNVLILQIECQGGDLQAARDLADDLRKLQADGTDGGLMVVGYIPDKAPDTAAIVAMGCSEIVMSKRKDAAGDGEQPAEATIGDFEAALSGKGGGEPLNPDAWAASLRQLADDQGYPPLLAEGMVKRDLEIVRARAKTDRARKRLMTAAEFEADKANWESDGTVKPKGQLLKLTATEAEQLGLARATVDNRDPAAVYARYGLDPAKVQDARPAWLDRFAEFLKQGPVTTLLVVIAFTGLILELKVPGTTVPGIVSALCFILVFWAHTQFSGQLAVLAGLLFLLGLVLVLVEIFVLPGFGACGIFGIMLILGSLALATMNEVPHSADEWTTFGTKMATYLLAIMAGFAVALGIARYIPHIPGANRLMLAPPDEQPGATDEPVLPGAAQAASLLGAVGTAVTVLRPAGSVRFGDQFIDVVSEGGYIPSGARVQAIEVEGTRIVVKEV